MESQIASNIIKQASLLGSLISFFEAVKPCFSREAPVSGSPTCGRIRRACCAENFLDKFKIAGRHDLEYSHAMKTALITGVSGQDGAYLAKFLLDQGYRVCGTSRDARVAISGISHALGFETRCSWSLSRLTTSEASYRPCSRCNRTKSITSLVSLRCLFLSSNRSKLRRAFTWRL